MSSASLLFLLELLIIIWFCSLHCCSQKLENDQFCNTACSVSSNVERGARHTYRYSTVISTTSRGSSSSGSQLAFDCVVDIDVIPGCQLRVMKLRNPQIKQSSSKRDNAAQRFKSIREALERHPLRFSLLRGKVTALCPQEAEQVWTLNIKRALLSMFQTSYSEGVREIVKESDVYGTCMTIYERKGPMLIKTRKLNQCFRQRISDFSPNSVPFKEDTVVSPHLQCTQIQGTTLMEKVNCTETMALVPLPGFMDVTQTKTISTLTLLRSLKDVPMESVLQGKRYLTDLRYEVEPPKSVRGQPSSQEVIINTVRMLCAQLPDQQKQSELFMSLVLHLRTMSLPHLRDVWREASFKCRDDWQPLLEALPTCGTEECILLTTDLFLNNSIEQDHFRSLLNSLSFVPKPTPSMISRISVLLQTPDIRPKVLLTVSSLVHRLCQRDKSSCHQIPEVQQFISFLTESLGKDCGPQGPAKITELLHLLKAVGNAGLAASSLVPKLNRCIKDQSAPLELRLAAVQAFKHIPCHADRRTLIWAYQAPQENVEVRIAAYLQLMCCPNQEVFKVVKTTLSNEKSSQVGSFVWSHLSNILKTEDPFKKELMESLPDDIISKDFEAESWKYSSYFDLNMDTGFGAANVEGMLVFSPESFLPRSAMANLTLQVMGRAFNLLEIDFRMENAEPLLKNIFEGHSASAPQRHGPQDEADPKEFENRKRRNGKMWEAKTQQRESQNENCKSNIFSHLKNLKTKFTGQRVKDSGPRCWIGVKMFGIDLTFMTCDDIFAYSRELSLNAAEVAVKLLKGQEVKLNHRAVVWAEELILPSLSGLPIKFGTNMSSLFSLRLKGSANHRDWSHFSLSGYIKPHALVSISVRIAVDGAFGRAGLDWVTQFRTATSLDGSVQMQHGQSIRVVLNTPEDTMDIVSLSSRMYCVNGDSREEFVGTRNRMEKTTCTPKTWSKMVGWQLCSDMSYPLSLMGKGFPPPGPVLFSLRLLKLDRGLHQYLLEAAYAFVPQRNSWIPLEATLLLFLGTPQSTIPRDVSIDFSFSPQRLLLKLTHPLKTILIQGQLEQLKGLYSGRLQLLIDNIHHYYLKGLMETLNLPTEKRVQFHLEGKVALNGHPIILSVNVTHGLSRKIGISAMLQNVFNKPASFSVQLERRQDDGQRQYSVDAGFLLPGLLRGKILGLLDHRGPEWSSAFRLRYSMTEETQRMQECHMSQSLRTEMKPVQTYHMRAQHELHCSQISSLNHKIQLRHEKSPVHVQSSLDLSYGKHWDQGSNNHKILLSQSIRNQSRQNLTSYTLEITLQVPEKGLNYRTQLLHSHVRGIKAESSTHLKVNYNDQMPLVAGLHWRDLSSKSSLKKWEVTFNMDTPWLYIYLVHKLSQPQHGITHFTSELTTRKWVTIRSLVLETLYRERSRIREGHLHIFTPTVTYLKVGSRGMLGKRSIKASYSLSTAWTPGLLGEILVVSGRELKSLVLTTSYGKQNLNISANFTTLDKKLKKRLVMMRMVLSEQRSHYVELEMEGGVEEQKKDRRTYKKRWMLRFRQPFHFLPQSLLLQETFTVDLHQGVYILESRALLHGNKKVLHTLTLGNRQPFVCSSLTHAFSSEIIPQDSEMCVTIHSSQKLKELQGKLRIGKKEKLVMLGQVNFHGPASPLQGITIKANITQLLQLQLPISISLEGNVSWSHSGKRETEYLIKTKATVNLKEFQFLVHLNTSSNGISLHSLLSHPYNSTVPKKLQTNATLKLHPAGSVIGSLCWTADELEKAKLNALLAITQHKGVHAVSIHIGLHQTMLPAVTSDANLQLSANSSSDSVSVLCALELDRETFRAELTGSLEHSFGLRASLTGNLRNSLAALRVLPESSSLDGILTQTGGLTEGELTVMVDNAVYGVELSHQMVEEGVMNGEALNGTHTWICVLAVEQSLCVNISSTLTCQGQGGARAQLSHSVPRFLSSVRSGQPFSSSVDVHWCLSEGNLSTGVKLQTGTQNLRNTEEKGIPGAMETTGHFKVNCTEESEMDHLLCHCSGHTLDPTHKMEVWTNLTNSSNITSVNPESSSYLSFVLRGHRQSSSVCLMVHVSHNISLLQPYLPSQFYSKTQLTYAGSAVEGVVDLEVDRKKLHCQGEFATSETGYKQVLELNHSFPQLWSVPSNILVRSVYSGQNGSHMLEHRAQWIRQQTVLLNRSTDHPEKHLEDSKPEGWGLEMKLIRDAHKRLGNVLVDWTLRGMHKEVRGLGSWSIEDKDTEATIELIQPFTSTVSHLHLHTLSHIHSQGHGRSNQFQFSWDHGRPVNVSLTISKQGQTNSTRGQACVHLSPGQMQAMLPLLVDMEGCISAAQEGNSYSQNAELKWSDKRLTQNMKYQGAAILDNDQFRVILTYNSTPALMDMIYCCIEELITDATYLRGTRGMHTLQVEVGAHNVSPSPCPSHTLLAQIHTNCRNSLEHHILLGVCPPHPALVWSGHHRVSSGKELFYSQTGVSVSGQARISTFTLALTNTSTSQRTNYSIVTEWQVGNWTVELGGRAVSSSRGPGLLLQAKLDRSDRVWLQGALTRRCLQATVGYDNGLETTDDITVAACLEGHHQFVLEAIRQGNGIQNETVFLVSMNVANQSLLFKAKGCQECLWATEARVEQLGSRLRNKALERVQKLQHLLMEFKRQSLDSVFLQELTAGPLSLTQRAQVLLLQRAGALWAAWKTGSLRYSLTKTLPHFLQFLHHMTQLVQQELKKPLATLAGAYHDVTGQRLDTMWRQGMDLWIKRLAELLPAVLEDHHQMAPSQTAMQNLITILNLVSQHTVHWTEARLAASLAGIRRRLASIYKLSDSNSEVMVRVPLPQGPWLKVKEAGIVEVLLEEFLLKPLLDLSSLSPAAELYYLKRKLMDSPFNHQAVLVADQFAVSFDGRLFRLPDACSVVLVTDIVKDSFTITLGSESPQQRSLVMRMKNTTVTIHSNGEVEVNCRSLPTPYSNNDITVRKDLNVVEVTDKGGLHVSCFPSSSVCTVTMDGWLHGVCRGLLGTNDNEEGNELPLPGGWQANSLAEFTHSWQVDNQCDSDGPQRAEQCQTEVTDSLLCAPLFSSPNSPLSPCFRVVDPAQFLAVCSSSLCDSTVRPNIVSCRLAFAYLHLCRRNYVPLEVPIQCG